MTEPYTIANNTQSTIPPGPPIVSNRIPTSNNPQDNSNYYCIDCDKTLEGAPGGKCAELRVHTVNKCNGFLCSKHYTRATQYGGKCDQCCWDEIT
mgnify:CR=1 FL=1|jgi:hypothetical protein